MLASFTFIPLYVLLALLLAVSIVMLARPGAATPIEPEPAPAR
jgi:hypothetical protein